MSAQEQFDDYARAALARFGVEVDEVELRVMHAVERVYGPPRDALLGADLSDVEPEIRLDPSRPPRLGAEP